MKTWADYYESKQYDLSMLIRLVMIYQKYLNNIEANASGPRGLEIGFGTGWASIYFSHKGYEIFGIDKDRDLLTRAVEYNYRLGGKVCFREMDMFHLDFESDYFDFVFHQGILEHFEPDQIRAAIYEQLRVAKRVIFSVPSEKYGRKDYGNENLWSVNQWLEILKPFRVVSIFGFNYMNDFAKFIGFATQHPRYTQRWWVKSLDKVMEQLFAGEIGVVVEKFT